MVTRLVETLPPRELGCSWDPCRLKREGGSGARPHAAMHAWPPPASVLPSATMRMARRRPDPESGCRKRACAERVHPISKWCIVVVCTTAPAGGLAVKSKRINRFIDDPPRNFELSFVFVDIRTFRTLETRLVSVSRCTRGWHGWSTRRPRRRVSRWQLRQTPFWHPCAP